MTSPETQVYLIFATELELDIRATFKELDHLQSMINHEEANTLINVTKDIILEARALLGHINECIDVYNMLINLIQDERPLNWRALA